jgi:dihydroxyacetone kinase-like predicted kinase
MGGGDSTVKNATDLANKLLATGKYYMITHTPDSIIISDEKGTTTTVHVDTEGPTYIQNEEQQVGGLWKTINNITEEEYIEKSKKAQEKKD